MEYFPLPVIPLDFQLSNGSTFYYELVLPLVCTFIFCRYVFAQTLMAIGVRKIFKFMEEKHEKEFVFSVFYVLCIIASVTIGEMATHNELFRIDYDHTLIGWPGKQYHSPALRFYFTYCISFYIYSLLLLSFIEEKKKDFTAMFLHHVVTIVTVTLSSYIESPRMAILVMLLFDACDIALESAKNFYKSKRRWSCYFFIHLLHWIVDKK